MSINSDSWNILAALLPNNDSRKTFQRAGLTYHVRRGGMVIYMIVRDHPDEPYSCYEHRPHVSISVSGSQAAHFRELFAEQFMEELL